MPDDIFAKIKALRYDQLEIIVKARRAVPMAGFLSVNGKARNAAIQRHRGWGEELLKYSNASIEASVRAKVNNAVNTAAIISAFESMGLGIITKVDLTLEEYDLIISPVISAFPELIVITQDWTPVPLEASQKYAPWARQDYQPPPDETRDSTKKARPYRRKEDLEKVEETVDMDAMMEALRPKITPVEALSKDEAIQKMLDTMKPKITKSIDPLPLITEEDAPFTKEVISLGTEQIFEVEAEVVEIEIGTSALFIDEPSVITSIEIVKTSEMPKYVHLQPSTEGDGFRLIDFETAKYWGPTFATPIEGIIWAAKEGIKIK